MKTTRSIYSLIYFDASKKVNDFLSVTNGPFLFEELAQAKANLLSYVLMRIENVHLSEFIDYVELLGVQSCRYLSLGKGESDKYFFDHMIQNNKDKLSVDSVISWYSELVNDELVSFGYEITEHDVCDAQTKSVPINPESNLSDLAAEFDGVVSIEDATAKATTGELEAVRCIAQTSTNNHSVVIPDNAEYLMSGEGCGLWFSALIYVPNKELPNAT